MDEPQQFVDGFFYGVVVQLHLVVAEVVDEQAHGYFPVRVFHKVENGEQQQAQHVKDNVPHENVVVQVGLRPVQLIENDSNHEIDVDCVRADHRRYSQVRLGVVQREAHHADVEQTV